MFEFEFTKDRREVTIRVQDKKFDITSAADFREQVGKNWSDTVENVVMDFSRVEYVDSSGVGAPVPHWARGGIAMAMLWGMTPAGTPRLSDSSRARALTHTGTRSEP
mgnify:CR=1 FL=1